MKDSSFDQAQKNLAEAESVAQIIGDPHLKASAAWEQGALLIDAKEDSLALQKLDQARDIYFNENELLQAARVSIAKAKAYENLRDFRNVARELENIYPVTDSLANAKTAGYVHNFLGLTLWKLGRLASAERHFIQAIDFFKKANLPKRVAQVHNNLGVIYFNWNRYEPALTNYRMASAIYDSVDNQARKVVLMANIGATYLRLGNREKARQTLLEALHISESNQYERGIINAYHWLARVEYDTGNYALATSYNEIALDYYRKHREYTGQIKIQIELGRIYTANLDLPRGEAILREATEVAQKLGDLLEEARAERVLGYNLILQMKYPEAEASLNRALKLARQELYREVEMHTLSDLGTLKYLTHQMGEGQILEQRSESLRDSLFNADLQRKIGELQVHFDLEERDYQIQHLNETAELQEIALEREQTIRMILLSGIVALLLMIAALVWGFYILRRNRDTIELQRIHLMDLNKKLQASLDAQHRLFRIISHDLKSPMGTMNELLALIVKGEVDTEASKEILKTASETANGLYRLIENLFSWARLQSGELEIRKNLLDLTDLLTRNIEPFQGNMDQKQLEMIVDYQHQVDVYADSDMTATIIRNLLSNALKFTHSGGTIYLRTRDNNSEGMVEIEIQDTGIGIPAEALPHIFDPKKSLRRRGTNKESTSGLGLVLVKDFIDLQQGSIRVESEEGVGSIFTISLPTEPTNESAKI